MVHVQLCDYTKIIKSLNTSNGWIVWCVNCVSIKLFFNKNRHSTLRRRPPDGDLTGLVSSCLSPAYRPPLHTFPKGWACPGTADSPGGIMKPQNCPPPPTCPPSASALWPWGSCGASLGAHALVTQDALRHVFALSGASLQSAAAPALRRAPPPGQRLFSSLGSCYLLTPVPGLLAEPNFQKLLEVSCKAHPGPQHTLGWSIV